VGSRWKIDLQKYAGDAARSPGSSPKLQVFNTALMTVASGMNPEAARSGREFRGRLIPARRPSPQRSR
jgi:hypothetical protein